MKQIEVKTNFFEKRDEEGQNPFIGFTSFQHFRGEALYSDIVVCPERNGTETENVECYPVPDYVPQKGREEGYYPDTSVVYIRMLWKEFEPKQGEYNYKIIEEVLERAKACGQTVAFRLMPHSTRAEDDVPDWLKSIIPCPERPKGKRVKESPTAPEYLELFGKAIEKMGEHFDGNPILYSVDICLPGAWGEGSRLHLYSMEHLKKWVDTFLNAFKQTQLIAQSGVPELIHYANKTRPVGWRADGIGLRNLMQTHYTECEAQLSENWKTAPVCLESIWWLGEWKRQDLDIDWIMEKTLQWHISQFNPKSIPIPYEWEDKIKYWISQMGYHFSPVFFTCPTSASPGEKLKFELCMDNHGVAPIYVELPLMLCLKNAQNRYPFRTKVDIRKWYPGKTVNELQFDLPMDILPGEYEVGIGIFDENIPLIYFGTDAVRDGSYYILGRLTINEPDV